MDWLVSFRKAIDYMEQHLLTDISVTEVAEAVYISPSYFQKAFKIVTGYSVGEYLRNRRLYLAGLDLLDTTQDTASLAQTDRRQIETGIIDLADKYGYDTPESFTKAFSRFHGLSPTQLRLQPHRLKVFLPLIVEISIRGGVKMDYTITKKETMQMIGYEKIVSYESSYQEIPAFWDEMEEALTSCRVGEFGVCVMDNADTVNFRYYIAGLYQGGAVPEGMTVFEIPACEWAQFKCTGAMPDALQAVNTRIFSEWLPGNQEYEMALPLNIEWYSNGDPQSSSYESAIWIPVTRK